MGCFCLFFKKKANLCLLTVAQIVCANVYNVTLIGSEFRVDKRAPPKICQNKLHTINLICYLVRRTHTHNAIMLTRWQKGSTDSFACPLAKEYNKTELIMDIYDMCWADLCTYLDKVFTIVYINRLISFLSHCGPNDSWTPPIDWQ
jgi:hypothetical protein